MQCLEEKWQDGDGMDRLVLMQGRASHNLRGAAGPAVGG